MLNTPAIAYDAPVKIFLVEDNDDTRELMSQLLQGCGYDVSTAGDMQSALRDFPGSGAEVLLSDLGLPDGDGWELLRDLKEAGMAPYAIAMSGFGTVADVSASMQAGFRHHLVKPVDWDNLQLLLEGARQAVAAQH